MAKRALYVRALDIELLKEDISPFVKKFEVLNETIPFDKVYLETHRDQVIPDKKTLISLKYYLEDKGIAVSGGITVTVDENDSFRTYCYSNENHRQKIRSIVEMSVSIFDEVLFDDFFFTNCKCEACIRNKGDLSWSSFRLKQMFEASKSLVIEPAKEVNKKAKVMIKYPNWYEHFQGAGFNLEDQPSIYDGIYTGNETRDPYYGIQHLQPYQSYALFRYYEHIKQGGNKGGWVDTLGINSLWRYGQQIWLTLLAKAPELTFFDYRGLQRPVTEEIIGTWPFEIEIGDTMAKAAKQALSYIEPIIEHLGNPVGVKAYKPYHSSGEDFLHNYIGMLGIPMDMVPKYPEEASLLFMNASAAKDPKCLDRMKDMLIRGDRVVVTSGLVKALEGKGFSEIAEIDISNRKLVTETFVMGWEQVTYRAKQPIMLSMMVTRTNDVWEEISAISGWAGTPLVISLRYGKGKMYILNLPDNFDDLYYLPTEVLDKIRRIFSEDTIDIYLEDTPTKISLMVYDNDTFAVASFLDDATEVVISGLAGCKSIEAIGSQETMKVASEGRARFILEAGSLRCFRIIR